MKFIHLIQNEIMKLNAKKQTVLFFSLLAVLVLLAGLIGKFYATDMTSGIGYAGFSVFMQIGLGFLITLFGLVTGSQILTDEYKEGTIKQLLIRPSSRTTILLSKYVTVLIMLVSATLFLMLFSSLVGLIFSEQNQWQI
ncbi:ABC transporter permease [Brevibacillus laterosporus]